MIRHEDVRVTKDGPRFVADVTLKASGDSPESARAALMAHAYGPRSVAPPAAPAAGTDAAADAYYVSLLAISNGTTVRTKGDAP